MDPFLGDEALRQAVVRLNNGDHTPLADLLQQAPPYSVALLSLMSDSVSFDLDALDHWAFQDPSPAAYVVRSVARIGQAWHARGRRMAKKVDQESWSTFFAILQKAED
ncbi:MAG: hypothetical protein OEM40_09205, partial [Acidimicrobiia bacterium]|nr:hypothetical protein [Acidimicrobiia bacterium]